VAHFHCHQREISPVLVYTRFSTKGRIHIMRISAQLKRLIRSTSERLFRRAPGQGGKGSADAASLSGRLREHAASIKSANNLLLSEFQCRYLVVEPLRITMAERFLIEHYEPIWNVWIEGFGNHDPGSGRHAGVLSWWDTLHPGRPWAQKLRQTRSEQQAIDRLAAFVKKRPPTGV
jgi:hypothetical protein